MATNIQQEIDLDSVHDEQGTVKDLKPIVLTAILVFVSAVMIPAVTSWQWNMPFGLGTRQIVLNVFLGMFLALPILLSIWTTLGAQTWLVRIPSALGIIFGLLCAYLLTIKILDQNTPAEILWMFAGVALAVTVVVQIPLWILRIWLSVRITRDFDSHSVADSQFSIKQLLICTTVIAVTIPFIQWLISIGDIDRSVGVPLSVVVGFCTIFILVMLLLVMLSLLIVFGGKLRGWCIGVLCLAWLVIPFAIISPLTSVMGRQFATTSKFDMGLNVATFSISHSLTVTLALALYFAIGFRMERIERGI